MSVNDLSDSGMVHTFVSFQLENCNIRTGIWSK